MKHLSGLFLLLAASIAPCSLARAEQAAPPDCRNGTFVQTGGKYSLSKITGEDKAFLLSDTLPCPGDSAACRSGGYLIPGDLVIAGQSFGAYRCVFYRNQKDSAGSAGYVHESRLLPEPTATLTLDSWLGKWRKGDDYISLLARGGKLRARGEAFWPSANPSKEAAPGGPHLGEMSGSASPTGNRVTFIVEEDECHVKMTLLPPFMLAADNQRCGGMNVSFGGVYLLAPPASAGGRKKR